MRLAWLPWFVPALLLANGIFSFVLGYRSKRSVYLMTQTQGETATASNAVGLISSRDGTVFSTNLQPGSRAPGERRGGDRVVVRPDLGLFTENEMLRDALATAEATLSDTEHSLRETKAALARSEARILDSERIRVPITRSMFAPRARQVGPR